MTRLELPAVGFGTYTLSGQAGLDSVTSALDAGYRLIDSAFNYENEGTVGAAVRRSRVPRDEVIVTSKLPGRHHAYQRAVRTIEESVMRTGLDHLDLYLIHWPNPLTNRYVEAWQALIDARERGIVRDIGVSNFLPEHLDRLEAETGVTPLVNQVELHPYFPQEALVSDHRARGIAIEAWSPVGRTSDLKDDPVIVSIARAQGKTPVQVVLRWHLQRGVIAIPKAASREHQNQNLDLFDFVLSDEEMALITGLGRTDGRLIDQDPATHEEF